MLWMTLQLRSLKEGIVVFWEKIWKKQWLPEKFWTDLQPTIIFFLKIFFYWFLFRDDSSIFDGLMEEDEKDKAKR